MSKHKTFLSLLVRCVNEPYMEEFINHYFEEGFTAIHIIVDMKKHTYKFPKHIVNDNRIFIYYQDEWNEPSYGMYNVNEVYKKIRDTSEWFMHIDSDEYVTCKKHPNHRIRTELKTTFKDVDCVKVPWVFMSCNRREKDPKSVLQDLTYRWDHDKKHELKEGGWHKNRCRHETIEIKSIFKSSKYDYVDQHIPTNSEPGNRIEVNSINGKVLNGLFYRGLRNHDIENGYLLCYHYRMYSIETLIRKQQTFTKNWDYIRHDIETMLSVDYAEVIDESLKKKSIKRNNK